jgi:O-glycosyl hydrolase
MRNIVVSVLLLACLSAPSWAEIAVTDGDGQITGLSVSGDFLPVQASLRIPQKGWGKISSTSDAQGVKQSTTDGTQTWSGLIEVAPGKDYRFTESLTETGGQVNISYEVTAEADVDIEGVFLFIDVPISMFSGGRCVLSNKGTEVGAATMPVTNIHFVNGTANGVEMSDAADRTSLTIGLDRALPVVVQDTRQWKGTTYSAFCQLVPTLKSGETTSLQVTLKPTDVPDHSPAHLTVSPNKARYHLDGFGGDYCFNIESPVTQYTLDNLHIACARTEMRLWEWEPENHDASADAINWPYLESQDKPGSDLHRQFLLAKQIQNKGVPYVISVWHLPEWLYADPGKGPSAGHRTVPPEKWPELLECIGSYLLYARRKYGVEPNYFSFNEPNYGVEVYLSPEDHRDAIKRIGAYLQKLGLKTKMALGDVTGPPGPTFDYVLPAANDPDAMKYVGALTFHSWGGGSAQDYEQWGNLAQRLHVPLFVTELGVDSGAWRTHAFDTYHYAMDEVRMYQDILLYARPQGTMQWEFTSDYGIVNAQNGPDGKTVFVPNVRFYFVKQFCNLTPQNAEALATTSDNSKVLFTAFAGTEAGKRVYTCHIGNFGASRTATLRGLPAGVTRLRAVCTSETESFKELAPVSVKDGKAEVALPEECLLTLTTMK